MGDIVMSAGELLRQANRLKRAGNLDEAITLYRRAITINPNFAWAYYNLGGAFRNKGDLDDAIIEYHRAIKLNQKSVLFYTDLGRVLVQKNLWDEAIGYFEKAIQIKRDLNVGKKQCVANFQKSATNIELLLEDIKLIENTYTHWQLADWGRLPKLTPEILHNRRDRAKLAVFVAVGYLWRGENREARDWVKLALDWEASQQYMSRIIISSIQNSCQRIETFAKARSSWYVGDWEALVRLDKADLVHHPERGKLALLAAAGYQQLGDMAATRRCTNLALEWGCSRDLVFQVLASGTYNLLGRGAAAVRRYQLSCKYFSAAFSVMNGGEDNLQNNLLKSRVKKQIEDLSCLDTKKAIAQVLKARA